MFLVTIASNTDRIYLLWHIRPNISNIEVWDWALIEFTNKSNKYTPKKPTAATLKSPPFWFFLSSPNRVRSTVALERTPPRPATTWIQAVELASDSFDQPRRRFVVNSRNQLLVAIMKCNDQPWSIIINHDQNQTDHDKLLNMKLSLTMISCKTILNINLYRLSCCDLPFLNISSHDSLAPFHNDTMDAASRATFGTTPRAGNLTGPAPCLAASAASQWLWNKLSVVRNQGTIWNIVTVGYNYSNYNGYNNYTIVTVGHNR